MPYSSGSFSLVAGNPVVTGTTISSTWANNTLNDIANNGLSIAVLKDGTQTLTANIPFAGFKVTGLGNGSAVADSVRLSQVQNNAFNILTGVSGVTTITGNASVSPAAYAEGQVFRFVTVGANAAGPTLNVNSLGAAPIFWNGTTATASQFRSGMAVEVIYLAASVSTASQTGFHVTGYTGFIPSSLISARGDLLVGGATNSVIVLPRGTDDQVLAATASASAGVAWKSATSLVDAATDSAAGKIEIAIQSEMETPSSTTLAVVPGRVRFHPGVSKAWALWDSDGALVAANDVSSVTDSGTGNHTVNWGTAFSTGNYVVVGTAYWDATNSAFMTRNVAGGVSSLSATMRTWDSAGAAADATNYVVAAFGDQS